MKINYQIEMEREIAKIRASGRRPRLLLHSCCAPCSSHVLEVLNADFDLTVYYYNPNIAPEAEFEKRVEEQIRLVASMPLEGKIEVIRGEYDAETFMNLSKGLEDVPEGGERCTRCFRLRLGKTAQAAAQGGYDYFTTTLSISPLKDAQRLNAIGGEFAQAFGVPYLFSDFKKKNGYKRSCELSAQYGLYRQDYCGCIFSQMERERQKQALEQDNVT
ncbi:MAG: epoxyqueuosine reductase QueH [Clostridiales bacterium]|nr:epoxyqueuosine reductase QueH [Clostridiales bacterium]